MRIAILSGKGGAGKTMLAVNLANTAGNATYIDCDVEEPNGHLFFKPEQITQNEVYTFIPTFDATKCTGCRKCVNFCHFNALAYVKEKPMLFTEVCHSCGGCQLVCPEKAISEIKRPIGVIEKGKHNTINVITGILNPNEASGIPIIHNLLQENDTSLTIIDCPPGSACPVMESISNADFCLLVVEPTIFGFHNFKMVYELVQIVNKKCAVIINKEEKPFSLLDDFCKENNIPIFAKIPFQKELAESIANGSIISDNNEELKEIFQDILHKIGKSL